MDKQEWENRLSKMEKSLEKADIKGCYAESKVNLAVPINLGAICCRGCWGNISGVLVARKHRYCKECMNTRNSISDYQTIFREVTAWMENFVKLDNYYCIKMNWNQSPFGGDPVRVKVGILPKSCILARARVKGDAIPKFIVYSYMELWMNEKDKNNKTHRKLCEQFLKKEGIGGGSKVVSYWYMIQYMCANGQLEDAQKGRELFQREMGNGLEELIKKYKLWEQNDPNDDRASLERMLCAHPALYI